MPDDFSTAIDDWDVVSCFTERHVLMLDSGNSFRLDPLRYEHPVVSTLAGCLTNLHSPPVFSRRIFRALHPETMGHPSSCLIGLSNRFRNTTPPRPRRLRIFWKSFQIAFGRELGLFFFGQTDCQKNGRSVQSTRTGSHLAKTPAYDKVTQCDAQDFHGTRC